MLWRNDQICRIPNIPAGLGYDCAGVADAVGKDVTDFAVGDTVSTIPAILLNSTSPTERSFSRPICRRKHPESLSFVEAASV